MSLYRLSPSAFAFLYDDCKRCWYRQVKLGIKREKDKLPAVFSQADVAMKAGITPAHLHPVGLKAVEFVDADWVESKPHMAHGVAVYTRGCLDRLVRLENGELAILDYKWTYPSVSTTSKYARQIHAYEWALRDPAKGEPMEITKGGLLCFNAFGGSFKVEGTNAALCGKLMYLDTPIDRIWFSSFLDGLCKVLAGDEPQADSECKHCAALNGQVEGK